MTVCHKLFPSEKAKKRQSKSKKGRKGQFSSFYNIPFKKFDKTFKTKL
jgi:hypothetical protein